MINEISFVTGSKKTLNELAFAKNLIHSPVPSSVANLLEIASSNI
ncbi:MULTISPECIES: hypothetical protein [unclassified Shigella]|nr:MULTISPECIES: hypothetical protein [unclassified Shigella]